jgi:hypothetical protein
LLTLTSAVSYRIAGAESHEHKTKGNNDE